MKKQYYSDEIETLKTNGGYQESVALLQSYIAKYPTDVGLYEELADSYLFLQQIDRARTAAEYAYEISPESPTTLYLMGYIHLTQGNVSVGVEYLEKSNTLFPNNPEVLRNLGWGYTMMNRIQEGVAILKRALHLSPEDELIIEDLGMAFLTLGNIPEAREYLGKIGKEYKISESHSLI